MVLWPRKLLVTACCLLLVSVAEAEEKVDFNRDIRPILSNACFRCHGPDAAVREAELRLDIPDGVFAKRDGKAAIVAGHPARSELIRRITHADAEERMPPEESSRKLTATEIDLLRRWIREGAGWQQHWAFQPLVQPALP
ncbi:MAG: c-type cytochrome domain-containing protein [Pirellulaceae bacterium]